MKVETVTLGVATLVRDMTTGGWEGAVMKCPFEVNEQSVVSARLTRLESFNSMLARIEVNLRCHTESSPNYCPVNPYLLVGCEHLRDGVRKHLLSRCSALSEHPGKRPCRG